MFENYKIISFRTNLGSLVELHSNGKYACKQSYGYNGEGVVSLEEAINLVKSTSMFRYEINSIQKSDGEILTVNDNIYLLKYSKSLDNPENYNNSIIESFELLNNEVVIKLKNKEYYNSIVRIINVSKYIESFERNKIEKSNKINQPSDLYSLSEIEEILKEILDQQELKEVLKDFKKYKGTTKIKEEKFVLPDKWCIKITKENIAEIGKWFSLNNQISRKQEYTHIAFLERYLNYPKHESGHSSITKLDDYYEITYSEFKKYINL